MLSALSSIAVPALAQTEFDKVYPLTGRPMLQVDVEDASVDLRRCGECRTVHIHIDMRGDNLARYRLEEGADGNTVHLRLKAREEHSFFHAQHLHAPQISIELPGTADADINTGNGDLKAAELTGDLRLHTGNGNAELQKISGKLRINTGNGNLVLREGGGSVTLSTGNGNLRAEGQFSQVDAHSGNGKVDLTLAPGTRLGATSHLSSGNGEIAVRLPRDLQANLRLSTGSGEIRSSLPGTAASSSDRSRLETSLNGGGPALEAQTGSGNVRVDPF